MAKFNCHRVFVKLLMFSIKATKLSQAVCSVFCDVLFH